jgi:hypothetical protein
MPHLAELQTKYRKSGVQVISISDETVDEVDAFLKRPHPNGKESFAEVTAPYTLTTDADRSTHTDYMEAAEQPGIPTSFIVGKTGLVEWIGHPMELDEPLAAVVDGSWDREAYRAKLQRQKAFEEAVQSFAKLAGSGNFDAAAKMLNEQIAASKDEEIKQRWTMIQHQFNLMTGVATEADYAHYREDLKQRSGEPMAVAQYAYALIGIAKNGGKLGPLAAETVVALKDQMASIGKPDQPMMYNFIAELSAIDQQFAEAIAAQEKAVELADELEDERTKKRLLPFLDELKTAKKKSDEKKSDEK